MKLSIAPSIVLLLSVPKALAWGTLGHTTVAYIATNFVQESTKDYFQNILHNKSSSYLASVATWADSFRYSAAGRFSAPFHFIDALDNPPTSCGVEYVRDCGKKGCIVGAIQNYTSQLLDVGFPAGQRNMAAKFVIHFLGDIHQPLHDEALDVGGNTILVNFSHVSTNLHHVWDSSIPEKLVGGYSLPDAFRWATSLSTAITSGIYAPLTASWLEGMNIADPVSSSLGWAQGANQFVCTTVVPKGIEELVGTDLSGSYYEAAVPVVELQVARAGFRLAAWLDLIAEGVKTEL